MGDLNTLIATGGGYQAPNLLEAQTRGLMNQRLTQQISSEPELQRIEKERLEVEAHKLEVGKMWLEVKENVSKMGNVGKIDHDFKIGDTELTIKAENGRNAQMILDALEKNPDKAKEIIGQAPGLGVSITKREQKESPYGPAAIEAQKQKDINKALIEKQYGTGGKLTVEDQALTDYLKANPGKNAADFLKWKEKNTYAPQVELYENPASGETLEVNVRDPEAIAKANASGFNAMSPERKSYMSKIGMENATTESKMVTEAKTARGQITTLQTLDQLADRFETGKMAGVKMSLQQYAASFGLPVNLENLSSKEAFNALTQQLALQSRNQGEGMVLAGQMSDRDVQFLRDMNVQMIYTNSGNKKLLKIRMAMAKRQSDVSDLIETYKTEHKGRFDATGFEKYAKGHFGKTSIFGVPEGSQFTGRYHKGTGLPIYTTPDNKTIIPDF
jgi:hypothetical protein